MTLKKTVLIIDDFPEICSLVETVLSHRGYGCKISLNGQDGLDNATRHRPDLIILDILMPKMNGWEVIRSLRRNPQTASIPVIIFTGLEKPRVSAEAAKIGVDKIITKPCEIDDIVSAVDSVLKC